MKIFKRIKYIYLNKGIVILFKLSIIKILNFLKTAIICIFLLPISLLLLVLYPIIKFRFGILHGASFGTYVFDAEYYLRKKSLEKGIIFDFFFFKNKKIQMSTFANKLIYRNITVSYLARFFYLNAKVLGGVNIVITSKFLNRDPEDIFAKTSTQLALTNEEHIEGNLFLKKIGVSKGQKYICLVTRDSAYKKTISSLMGWSLKIWDHHNYRNSDIDDYKLAVNFLLDRGYFVIRMGNVVEKKLKIDHKNFLDYASSDLKSSFLDFFLLGNSYFNLVSEAGLKDISYVYNVPYVFVNCPFPKITINWHKSVFIYKKFKSRKLNRYLTFTELDKKMSLNNELNKNKKEGSYNYIHVHELDSDIEIINNTPEEIQMATKEILSRMEKNLWNDPLSDLEQKFWSIFPFDPRLHSVKSRSRLCNEYIVKNSNLL